MRREVPGTGPVPSAVPGTRRGTGRAGRATPAPPRPGVLWQWVGSGRTGGWRSGRAGPPRAGASGRFPVPPRFLLPGARQAKPPGRGRPHRRGGRCRCRGDGDAAAEVTLGEGPEVPDGAGTAGAMAEVEAAGSGAGDSPEAGGGGGGSGGGWRRPHGPLQRYYGPPAAEAAEAAPDPTDINGPHFDPEAFLTKVTLDPTVTSPPGAPGSGWRLWPEPRDPRAGPPVRRAAPPPCRGPAGGLCGAPRDA